MNRFALRPALALGLSMLAGLGGCAGSAPPSVLAAPPPPAPAALNQRLQDLAHGFDGKVGIAVEDVQTGWIAAYDGQTLYPQQSVAKLWTALALMDAVDRGLLSLDDPVTVRSADMSVFFQPIQKMLVDDGYATTLGDLLSRAIAESDNAANDILLRKVRGGGAVRRALRQRGLADIRAGESERELESRIAGVAWRPEYSFGTAFWDAREKIPVPVRQARLDAYVADPPDGATPDAVAKGLSRLERGELLSPASTARLLQTLSATQTGPLRLKAGLGPGWTIAHKTGTGQDLGDESTGYNDVGLLSAPDGRVYAVAVMIAATRRPIPEREALMADVARAVVAEHDAESGLSGRR
ncbi:MAG TPA: class A beta-lactamase [Caulobacteraceae bacterium]|nr:class A beta-lactamase [Caulobacteraceae bacterium]